MPNAENARLDYEAGQNPFPMQELTDQGDYKTFKSGSNFWSNKSGYQPDVKPNGVATGLVVSVAVSGSNDVVDVSAGTAYIAGVLESISAGIDTAIVRPAVNPYQKFSVTITSGAAIAIVDGTEGSSFSDTRGAAGGPPWIPNTSIEIAQIWVSSLVAAPITADEIKVVPGSHRENFFYPTWKVDYSEVNNGILGNAGVTFDAANAAIHSDDAGTNVYGKKVFASWYTPEFAEIVDAYDFVPPVNTHAITSKQVYGRTKGSQTSTINQGTFSAELQDGISDNILSNVDDILWFRFYQDRLNTPYIICQGKLGVAQSFPAGENITAACTISGDVVADRVTA